MKDKLRDFDDEKLLALLKTGDHLAYAVIYDRYKTLLYRHAVRILNNQEQVNDTIQDLFLSLWRDRDKLNIELKLSSYLYTAIRNRLLDHIARNKFQSDYIDSIQEYIQSAVPVTEQQVRLNELKNLIEKEVEALPPKMRTIFRLSRNEELSHREIAVQLNVSDHTVKKQINNAIKILKPKISLLLAIIP